MKVAGLGAPVSVQIRFQPCEGEVIADELRVQVGICETADAEARAGLTRGNSDDAGSDQLREFRQMLSEIERDGDLPGEPFEVIWPTFLAYDVLRGALGEAAERLREALQDLDAPHAIQDALNVVAASLDTWDAFLKIDNGGLQDVAL